MELLAKEKTKKKQKSKKKEKLKTKIWIGPPIKKIGLNKNTIFKEVPQHILNFLDEYQCRVLLVDISKLAEVEKKRHKKGNLYNIVENNLIDKLNKEHTGGKR